MRRTFALIAALFISMSSLLQQAAAQTAGPPAAGTSARQQSSQPQEIPSLRTRTSRTYLKDGVYTAHLYPSSIHYQDATGAWQPIDNTLVDSSMPGYARENRANRFTVRFPSDLGKQSIRLETHDAWLTMSLRGASGAGQTEGDTETYSLSGYKLAYTVGSDAVKENITLDGPQSPQTFVYDIGMSPHLTATQIGGRIDFIDESGAAVFSFPTPFMYDAAGVTDGQTGPVTQTLTQDGKNTIVTLSADHSWLAQPGRQWPVTIDPTSSIPLPGVVFSPDLGCMVVGSTPTLSYCASANASVGNAGGSIHRMLFHFNVASIPRDAQVASATLYLYMYDSPSTAQTVNVHALTRGGWTMNATWNAYDGVNPWTTPGGDFNPTPATSATVPAGAPAGYYAWELPQLAQGWVNGATANNGMILKAANESLSGGIDFWTTQPGAPQGDWPEFEVAYTMRTGQQSFDTMVNFRLSDRMDASVNVASGNFMLHASDLNMSGIGLPLTFDRYYNSLEYRNTEFGLGNGWAPDVGFGIRLVSPIFTTKSEVLFGPSNYGISFVQQPDGSYLSPPGIEATLVHNADSTFTLTYHANQQKYNFSSDGFLTSVVDRSGNSISTSYANIPAGKAMVALHDTQGRNTTVNWVGTTSLMVIQTVNDPAGRTHHYLYDSSFQTLISYTDPNNKTTSYGYSNGTDGNPSGILEQITDPNGGVTRISYTTDSYGMPRVSSLSRSGPNVPCANSTCTTTFTYNSFGQTTVTDANGHSTVYRYDALLRTTSITDAEGHTTSNQWNGDNQPTSMQDPNLHTTTYGYASDGTNDPLSMQTPTGATASEQYQNGSWIYQPSSSVDTQGRTTSYGYDGIGRAITVTDAAGHTTTTNYNPNGTVASVVDANGHQTSYAYSTTSPSTGLLTQITYPSPRGPTSYTYYNTNDMATATDGKGQVTTYTYDPLSRITGISYQNADGSSGGSVGYAYDGDGNVVSVTDSTGTTTYSYDSLNNRTRKQLPNGQVISCTYDGVGNLMSITDSGGTVSYGYSPADRITSVTDPASPTATTISYDATGNRTQIRFANGVTENMSYDSSNQLTRIWGVGGSSGLGTSQQTLTSYTYSYNNPNNGNAPTTLRWSMTDVGGNVTTYGYDVLNRLTSAVTKNGTATVNTYSFGYDNVGNITSRVRNTTSITATYDSANELIGYSGGASATYTYDANGQVSGSSSTAPFAYNAQNQTTSLAGRTMGYTARGQVQRTVRNSDSFQYSIDDMTVDEATLGGVGIYFTHLPDGTLIDERVGSGTYAGNYYYLTDALGSVVGLTNSAQQLANSYSYDSYGTVTATGSVPNPFLFTGAINDGGGFYKMGARYYDSTTMRFTQPDPATCASTASLYTYGNDDPIDQSDPSGMGPGCGGYACPKPGGGASIGVRSPQPIRPSGVVCGLCMFIGGFILSIPCTGFAAVMQASWVCMRFIAIDPVAVAVCGLLWQFACAAGINVSSMAGRRSICRQIHACS